jgi:multidrug transporter EmrE-like cation transporter
MYFIFLFIALFLNTTANIFMKLGAIRTTSFLGEGGVSLFSKFFNLYFVLGIVFFAFNLLFYFLALTKVNLSVAYPIMTSGAFLIISVFSFYYLKEPFGLVQIVGLVLILSGIILVSNPIK